MNSKKRCRDLMERIHQAHQQFKEVWTSVRTAELHNRKLASVSTLSASERQMEQVWEANGVAYEAAKPQAQRRDEILNTLFAALPFEAFSEGNPEAIGAILDFLEIDVPAFRCGYAKEWCFRKQKSLPLNPTQQERLRALTLALCQSIGRRRELKELARLMIKLADRQLVEELRKLTVDEQNEYTVKKAAMVLQIVLQSRPDLNRKTS